MSTFQFSKIFEIERNPVEFTSGATGHQLFLERRAVYETTYSGREDFFLSFYLFIFFLIFYNNYNINFRFCQDFFSLKFIYRSVPPKE